MVTAEVFQSSPQTQQIFDKFKDELEDIENKFQTFLTSLPFLPLLD